MEQNILMLLFVTILFQKGENNCFNQANAAELSSKIQYVSDDGTTKPLHARGTGTTGTACRGAVFFIVSPDLSNLLPGTVPHASNNVAHTPLVGDLVIRSSRIKRIQ